MRLPKILTAVATAMILFVTGATASAEPKATDYVEGVDWTGRVITVIGEGIVPPDAVNYTQAKGLAAKAAKADAYRKLAELINGVRVEGETTVEKMVTTQDRIQLRVEATIKGARVVSETFLSDGGYRVVMQVPIFGMTNSLANAVLEKPANIEPFPNPVPEVAPTSMPYNSSTSVKRRIEITAQGDVKVEEENFVPVPTTPYKPPLSRMALPDLQSFDLLNMQSSLLTVQEPTLPTVSTSSTVNQSYMPTAAPARKSVADYASMAQGDYTGLIVDCRGLELQPVMSPVIMNSNGTKIYGHKNLDIDKVISIGMADYINDTEHVDRAGENPIVVKALSLENFNSNPVISIPDSNRVLIENYVSKFLKDLKVVFLFD